MVNTSSPIIKRYLSWYKSGISKHRGTSFDCVTALLPLPGFHRSELEVCVFGVLPMAGRCMVKLLGFLCS